jgi:hypothetical protein
MARGTPSSFKKRKDKIPLPRFDGAARNPTGCRFILDDDGLGCRGVRWRYCQSQTEPGKSYCDEHRLRVYQPDKPREIAAETLPIRTARRYP